MKNIDPNLSLPLASEFVIYLLRGEVERLAHKIKGGVCYGTCRMFYACQYLERYYKAGHRTLLDKLYHQVLHVNDETISTLTEWLNIYTSK